MGYIIYLLASQTRNTFYIGYTENLAKRLRQHNTNDGRWTRGKGPWQLVHQEAYETLREARKREIFLKSGKGYEALKNLLNKHRASVVELADTPA